MYQLSLLIDCVFCYINLLMKKLLTFIFLFISFIGMSQTRFGLRSGVNFTTIKFKNGSGIQSTGGIISRFSGGLVLEFLLDDNWIISSGPYYSGKGARFGKTSPGSRQDSEIIRMNYVELPVLFGYKFSETNKNKLTAGAGPYAGYGFNGTVAWKGGRPATETHIHLKENDKYKRLDIGFTIFGTYQFKDKWGLRTDFSYSILKTNRNYGSEKNLVAGFSVYWFLPKHK